MRPCVTIEDFSSVHLAVEKMREAGQEVIPVTSDGQLAGVLTQKSLLEILESNIEKDEPVGRYVEVLPKILNRTSGAEALRLLENDQTIVVVDDHDVVCGLLTPSCFIGTVRLPERPSSVGGMATPFGVYLTTGSVRGGKHGWYLFSTGMFMMVFYFVGVVAVSKATEHLPKTRIIETLSYIAASLIMLVVFRFMPIAGYHAAEHMVVHALERDEELTPEVVSRMPRVHPRCGTNLAVGVSMFMLIWQTPWIPFESTRLMLGVIVTLYSWRKVGSLVQFWFTTRTPNAQQLASGIAAGKELLSNYEVANDRSASPLKRILNSGMLHVMAGSFLTLGIAILIQWLFGVQLIAF